MCVREGWEVGSMETNDFRGVVCDFEFVPVSDNGHGKVCGTVEEDWFYDAPVQEEQKVVLGCPEFPNGGERCVFFISFWLVLLKSVKYIGGFCKYIKHQN